MNKKRSSEEITLTIAVKFNRKNFVHEFILCTMLKWLHVRLHMLSKMSKSVPVHEPVPVCMYTKRCHLISVSAPRSTYVCIVNRHAHTSVQTPIQSTVNCLLCQRAVHEKPQTRSKFVYGFYFFSLARGLFSMSVCVTNTYTYIRTSTKFHC